ncbi:MAG: DUF2207 domain-containing protein [Haliea sp.]|uniref:DUF2207 domain-containing protein n=1 Tax=Haliea sp. TaxID=1932666 RepID=UPI0032ECD08F
MLIVPEFPQPGRERSVIALPLRLAGALFLALLSLLPLPAACAEEISRYDVEVEILESGDLLLTEHITVIAERAKIRKGIYRDFPTRYKDRWGNNVVVGFEVVEVLRDGQPEPWFTENLSNGVRVNTGDDRFLPVFPRAYRFTLRYRTDNQIGFFADHDELYWNAIGTGWAFAIADAKVAVSLPAPVPRDQLSAEGYTGVQGSKAQNYEAVVVAPGQGQWRITRPLSPGEGLTIVLSFPKGVLVEPSPATKLLRWFRDNLGKLMLLALLVPWLAYLVSSWWRVGRDPRRGVIFPRYEIPRGMPPGALRMMRRGLRFDPLCLTADILYCAVAGYFRIAVEDRRWRKDRWSLIRDAGMPVPAAEALSGRLVKEVFPTGAGTLAVDTEPESQKRLRLARTADAASNKALLEGTFYSSNGGHIVKAVLGYIAIFVVGMVTTTADSGQPFAVAILGFGILPLVGYIFLIGAPTAAGRQLLDEIDGFVLYLSVAEADDLERLVGPNKQPVLDGERFEQLLPYAVALEVADAWTARFAQAVGQDAAEQFLSRRAWYAGAHSHGLNQLTESLSSSFSSSIASSSAPPGSSSGSGGGGSSGGGGGGGGGGGR